MRLEYSDEHEALRQELRAYYKDLLTPQAMADIAGSEGVGPAVRKIVRQMGDDGWLGIGWPKEYGGRGMTPIEQFVFFDESMRAGAPVPMLTINSVAPTIMQFGTQEQKDFFLPKILKGEINFSIGYTEPESGTDLASLKTRADRDGDEWIINGTKVFTSLATDTDYTWLAVRTNQEVKKHKGISMIIVPTKSPGLKVVPIKNMGGANTNYTFYEDVRVPYENVVGEVNGGWRLITNQLNHERVTLCSSGVVEGRYDDVLEWARTTLRPDGSRVIDQPWVQLSLARIHARLDFLRLMNFKVAWEAEQGHSLQPAYASTIKVFGTEFYLESVRLMMEILGPDATLRPGSSASVIAGRLNAFLRGSHILTFGGGVNEMQRDLIAVFGLGMPMSPR
jgi:alkylation response protein AidB-like acyl-CoA dehydrogenase